MRIIFILILAAIIAMCFCSCYQKRPLELTAFSLSLEHPNFKDMSKVIKLTQGKSAIVDDCDYEYLNQFKWHAQKCGSKIYARRHNKDKSIVSMHRVILQIKDPKVLGDHKDGDGLNNQRYNLRVANKSQNCANAKSSKNSTSKYLGVYWDKRDKKWIAKVSQNYKLKYAGYFDSEVAAALAYNSEAIKIHGEFTSLNIII